jgi:holo-[acyl-carrier protein] synthase
MSAPQHERLLHGFDLVAVARIQRLIERFGPRFLQRVFTPLEQADCAAATPRPRYASLAARWAAKEACAKALRIGLSGPGARSPAAAFHDIEVVRRSDGSPLLRLSGIAAAVAAERGIADLAVSLSHDGGFAAASVVALIAVTESRQL